MCRLLPLIVCVFSVVLTTSSSAAEEPTNVVFILADDLGWNDIGYHNAEIRSPHLNALAAESVRLECHYVQPQCTPTRVDTMTGRYPSRFGGHCLTASNERALPPGTLTMASMFHSLGFKTALSGKWHLGSKPEWGPRLSAC